ncbi:30S ribosomal protein S9 [Candidatus Peregrinibacteria bacterium]|nr:30S ribosomal protein S9 [Candidatus Peregrinibacteria bacterium]
MEEAEESAKAPKKGKYFYAHGKRKTSIAKIRLYTGKGDITVNEKAAKEYFTVKTLIGLIKTPFKITGTNNKYDVSAVVRGGGVNSQAEALRHGITKALVQADPLNKPSLKKAGLLTRDSRVKERKKFGLKRARKGPQFSKR